MAYVESHNFSTLSRHERLYELAIAYLQSARCLCADMLSVQASLTWPRASVALYCLTHVIELFLKAAILARSPKGEKMHHDISRLMRRYRELYPDPGFYFHTPWNMDIRNVAKAFGGEVIVSDIDLKPDQLYRYFSNKDDALPEGIHSFGPAVWLIKASQIEDDWTRIWAKVREVK